MKNSRILLTLFLTVFLDLLGFGILIPILPVLLTEPSSPHYLLSANFPVDRTFLLYGALLAVYAMGTFFAAPIIGQLSDRFGRKRLLAFSLFGTGIGHFLFAFGIATKNIPLLFLARTFDGMTGGNIVVAQAAIADITTPENRSKNFGLIGAAFGLGFILGPFIGGKLSDPTLVSWFSPKLPFIFAGVLSFINTLFVLFFLAETHPSLSKKKIEWSKSLSNIMHALSLEHLRRLFVTSFLFQFGFTFYTTFSAVFLLHRFGFTESQMGDYFAFVGIWIALTQAVGTRMLSRRFSEVQIVSRSLFVVSIGLVAMLLTHTVILLYAIVPFFSFAIGLTQANLTALVSRRALPEEQGKVLGLNSSMTSLAMLIPPLLSGAVATIFVSWAPLLVSSIVICSAGVYFATKVARA
jgi:DHA1 family tetracycline resistance protein-like MFS transporter